MKYDLTRNIEEAGRELTSRPVKATTAELLLIQNRIRTKHREKPQPIRYGLYLAEILEEVSVPLEEYDLIAGRSIHRELNDEEEAIFKNYCADRELKLQSTMLDNGHVAYSWGDVVNLGLCGLKKRALDTLSKTDDKESRSFLEGALLIYEAIEKYLLRYSQKAMEMGLSKLSEVCRKAATEVPDDFYTALELLYIITFVQCSYITKNPTVTIGRMDQILYPLYKKGIESGTLTKDEACALITDFYCKHNLNMGRGEHQIGGAKATTFDRIYNFDAPQYLLLAGTDENGNSAVNELTELFAECIVPSFKNPVTVVRYFKGMNNEHPGLWKILCQKALQSSSMMFYNDTDIINAYKEMGLPDCDARKYYHFGCNWPAAGENSAWMGNNPKSVHLRLDISPEERASLQVPYDKLRSSAPHGFVEDFMAIFRRLTESGADSIEEFYTEFWRSIGEFLDFKLEHLSHELKTRKMRPSSVLTYADCFLEESMKKGISFAAGASKYYYELQSVQGLGTLIDCFVTVDELVFKRRALTLKELFEATEANFVGFERIRALCLSVDKFGSDSELSNYHAKRITRGYVKLIQEKSRPYLENQGLFLEPCLQSDTWHLKWGRIFGATPDGRLAGKPFSHNSRPSVGACKNGLTGMLNSLLSIPFENFMSGSLNVDLQKNDFASEKGLEVFSALFGSYFNRGGLHAQVSVNNREELIDAKENPEAHRDLRVRVTGYSGVFVDICEELQNDIIERTIKEG